MPATAEEIIISAPKLELFVPLDTLDCPMCGGTGISLLARLWLALIGKAASLHHVSYCSGGRPPVEDISSPIEAMMRGSSESRPKCGGIEEPHLHLKCGRCDFVRLMRTKAS